MADIIQDLKDKIKTEEEYLVVIKKVKESNEYYEEYQTKILETDDKLILLREILLGVEQLQADWNSSKALCPDCQKKYLGSECIGCRLEQPQKKTAIVEPIKD